VRVVGVIGRDFAFRLLKSIMEIGEELRFRLTNLVDLEILYEKALYPELEYIFKHALTQEVAYESLLKQRRIAIHSRIAQTIEELLTLEKPCFIYYCHRKPRFVRIFIQQSPVVEPVCRSDMRSHPDSLAS